VSKAARGRFRVGGPQYLTSAGLPTKTVCYPQNHQSNVKLFDLKTNTYWRHSPPVADA
jgi:hypothetical protein